MIGEPKIEKRLLAIKYLTLKQKDTFKLEFALPKIDEHDFVLFLKSDAYRGCDMHKFIDIKDISFEK